MISDIVRAGPQDFYGPPDINININSKNQQRGRRNQRNSNKYIHNNQYPAGLNNNGPRYPEGCHCYNTCDEYGDYQCGTKCSCDFWYETEKDAVQHSHNMMVKNAHFRDKYSIFGRTYRPGNDYYGRKQLEMAGDVDIINHVEYDRRDQSKGDPFKRVRPGQKSNSWDRYETDECHYEICRDQTKKQCAWFYDFYHCGQDRNNNGRYYDEYFARARLDFSSPGNKTGKSNNFGDGKQQRTRTAKDYRKNNNN